MNLIYEGKKKQLFSLDNDEKQYLLMKYKVNPNNEENCKKSILLSKFYFEKAEENGVDTHFVSADPETMSMKIKRAELFGKGLEFIYRYKAEGSFYRRFNNYIEKGHDLNGLVEIKVKSAKRGNPPILLNTLLLLNIMTEEEYNTCIQKMKVVADLIKEDLEVKGLTLYDIRFEFGKINGKIVLINQIASKNMTVYEGDRTVEPEELYERLNLNQQCERRNHIKKSKVKENRTVMGIQFFSINFVDGMINENIGISRLVAFLKQRSISVETTYVLSSETKFDGIDLRSDYKLFGFTIYPENIEYVMRFCKYIKNKISDAIIFVGGNFATLFYKTFIKDESIDLIIIGDGEYAVYEIATGIEFGKSIEKIAKSSVQIISKEHYTNKEPRYCDMNLMPFPERSFLEKKKTDISALIYDAQGCYGDCSFCGMKGNEPRTCRSATDIMYEIVSVYEKTKIRLFLFTSRCIIAPNKEEKSRLQELCMLLIKYPVKFSLRFYIRADSFSDSQEDMELLKLMKKAGFNVGFVGIESGNEEDLKLYNKHIHVEQNYKILDIMKKNDIFVGTFGFIMFNPYSNASKLQQNYEFLSNINCAIPRRYFGSTRLIPNTVLYEKAKNDQLLKPEYSLLNQSAFKINDSFANEIKEFFDQEFIIDLDSNLLMRIYENCYEIFNVVKPFINSDKLQLEMQNIINSMTELCRDYFAILYVDKDLKLFKEKKKEFIEECYKNLSRCKKITNRLTMEYLYRTSKGVI